MKPEAASRGSLSAVELLTSLYFGILEKEDKFFLSNGHICPAWFSVMAEKRFDRQGFTFEVCGIRLTLTRSP